MVPPSRTAPAPRPPAVTGWSPVFGTCAPVVVCRFERAFAHVAFTCWHALLCSLRSRFISPRALTRPHPPHNRPPVLRTSHRPALRCGHSPLPRWASAWAGRLCGPASSSLRAFGLPRGARSARSPPPSLHLQAGAARLHLKLSFAPPLRTHRQALATARCGGLPLAACCVLGRPSAGQARSAPTGPHSRALKRPRPGRNGSPARRGTKNRKGSARAWDRGDRCRAGAQAAVAFGEEASVSGVSSLHFLQTSKSTLSRKINPLTRSPHKPLTAFDPPNQT